jgi:DNA-binding protein YbaB
MFKEFAQIGQMLNQARQLSGKMGEMQQRLADLQLHGESLDRRVTVTVSGQGRMLRCQIAPELLEPSAVPALERAIVEAEAN